MLVIMNSASGTLSEHAGRERLKAAFHSAGLTPTFVEVDGGPGIDAALKQHPSGTVVAAGGDGTVSAVAGRLAGTGAVLGVIPGGTLNHFAKDLQIPQDFGQAVEVIRAGHVAALDIAAVNGHPFINNSSLGIYPEVVRTREEIRRRGFHKWAAMFVAAIATLRRLPFHRVRLDVDGRSIRRATPFVFVGNNVYELEGLRMGSRNRIDEGQLCVCVAQRMGGFALVRMAFRALAGKLRKSGGLDVLLTRELWIDTRPRTQPVSLDGEVVRLRAPLHYVLKPGALRVIVPGERNSQ
jgi:diacylglycerol kinase family enzyme